MRTPVIEVTFDKSRSFGDKYFHVNFSVKVHDSERDTESNEGRTVPSYPVHAYASDTPYNGLKMVSQSDRERMADRFGADREVRPCQIARFYGIFLQWDTDYRGCTLEHMEEGIKPMRRLHAKLEKVDEIAGYAKTMGQHIHRVAKAAGISLMYVHDGSDPRYHSIELGAELVDKEIGRWIESEKSAAVA